MPEDSVASLECASFPEEIVKLQSQLVYRHQLLEALLEETHRDLKALLEADDLNVENNPLIIFEDTELPLLINRLSQTFIDFIRSDVFQSNNPKEKEQILDQLRYQSSVLRNLICQVELQIGTTQETLKSMLVTQ